MSIYFFKELKKNILITYIKVIYNYFNLYLKKKKKKKLFLIKNIIYI